MRTLKKHLLISKRKRPKILMKYEAGPAKLKHFLSFIICVYGLGTITVAAVWDDLPVQKDLPDPLRMKDGRRVKTIADWKERRKEILALISRYEYGRVPPAPENVELDKLLAEDVRNEGLTHYRQVRLKMGPEQKLMMTLHIYFPAKLKVSRPAVLRIGLGDEAVRATNERGYIFACLDNRELDPDNEGYDVVGPAQKLYPKYDWGSLAVWAWGACRALDYLATLPEVDAGKVVITGHSRCGKTALLAGALDERFALVVPNGAGCGGTACARILSDGSESLGLITDKKRFYYWFQKGFGQFAGHEERLPFDQHFLKALIAPRPLLTTDAFNDRWANPLGNQAAFLGAMPVYNFLGVPENNMMHFRQGNHDQLPSDFKVLLDVAAHYFENYARPDNLCVLPYPDYIPKLQSEPQYSVMLEFVCSFSVIGWQPQAQLGDGFLHMNHPQNLRF
jgi:hypothetical protein